MRGLIVALSVLMMAVMPARAGEDMVTTFTLDNGLEVVVIEDRRAPVVQHMMWYRAGSADEPPGVSGIAHFLEHLMFKGTKTMEPGEFSSVVARNGGRDNAFTSFDFTGYFQRVAADRLGLMMEMEADRMINLDLPLEEVLSERKVIIEERNQVVENNPSALFREQLRAMLYLNHRYGAPIIGWQHEMSVLEKEDALEFYRQFYGPNNAVLIVAGDVDPDEVLTLAEKHYGPIPANPAIEPRDRPQEPRHMAARRLVMEDARVAQPYVMRSYLAPARRSGAQEEAAALTMLAAVLGDGTNSVLAGKLQFDSEVALHATAWYGGLSLDDTSFTLVAVPSAGVSLQEVEDAMDRAVAGFFDEGVDPEHLERIKSQIRAQRIYERDDVGALANRYGRALTQGLTVADVQAWPDILQEVTGDDIIAAARNVFIPQNSVTGWLTEPEVTQ